MTATLADIRLLERTRTEIGDMIEARSTYVASGALDYPEYKKNCGYIEGLNAALVTMADIVRSMGESR